MSDTVNYADAVKRCEELHDDNRQDLKLLSLEIARLKDELSKTEGYPGIVHDLERARADLSAAVRERDEARASATEANITLTAARQLYREARAECERLREDAERYRWLREKANFGKNHDPMCVRGIPPHADMIDGSELDAAIDAARRAG